MGSHLLVIMISKKFRWKSHFSVFWISYFDTPDSNFEQQLINKGIDSDNTINGQVATADIENITVLSVSDAGIQDMTGIQDFVSLEMLFCALNDITEINIAWR